MRNRRGLLAPVLGACLSFGAAAAEDLASIYQSAVENDAQFKAAAAARGAAREALPQGRAQLLPFLSFSVGATRTSQDVRKSSFSPPGTEDFTTASYSLTLSQPLYHRDYLVQLRQADARIAKADADYAAAEQALMVRVAERYFDLLAALDNLAFARAENKAIERQLEQTRQRFEVGLIAITDVHEAQAAFDQAAAQEIDAEHQLDSAQEALREITAQRPQDLAPLRDDAPLLAPEPADVEAWSDAALRQNYRVLAAEFDLAIARDEIERQRAGHYPLVDLTLDHSYTDVGGGSFGERETVDNALGVQVRVPLYAGGATSSRTREARARSEQAREDLERERRATLRQARDAYLSVVAGIARVQAFRQAVVSTQSALEATEAGLDVGTRTTVDVLAARRNLFRAQRDHALSRYRYLLDTLRLKQAAGTLAAPDLERISAWLK